MELRDAGIDGSFEALQLGAEAGGVYGVKVGLARVELRADGYLLGPCILKGGFGREEPVLQDEEARPDEEG